MLIQGIVNACAQVYIDFMNNKAYGRVQQLNFCRWNYARMFLHPHTDFLLEVLGKYLVRFSLCFSLRENLQSMPEWHTQSLTYWGNVLYDILSMLESFNKIISMCLIHPKLGSHVKTWSRESLVDLTQLDDPKLVSRQQVRFPRCAWWSPWLFINSHITTAGLTRWKPDFCFLSFIRQIHLPSSN